MPIAAQFHYRPGGAEDRLAIRDVHLEYMIRHRHLIQAGGAIVVGERVTGMYLLLRTDDDGEVDAFIRNEPYNKAGLFQRVDRLTFTQFMPEPREGFLEKLLQESRAVATGLRMSKRLPADSRE